MLFNSLEFFLFFPLVTALFFALPHERRWLLLLVASYTFYMAWEPVYGLLILFSTTVDWYAALRIAANDDVRRRRAWLAVSLLSNFGLLFSFKYYNLFNDTAAQLAAWAGWTWHVPRSSLLLPVGISFYTFQAVSYTIDVYRGRDRAEPSLGMFALYVAYFPQLVAGPVERAGHLLPQLHARVTWDTDRAVSGLRLMTWGLFKKVVVADRLAILVEAVYADPQQFAGFGYVVATAFFVTQLYCDFSGYSDMAVGIARVLGVNLMTNFDQPHLATSLNGLWSRWHISMTTWFRDYVYVSMGGNRHGELRKYLHIFLTMVLSGLWHGAMWHYVVWGTLSGALLVIESATAGVRNRLAELVGLAALPRFRRVLATVVTVLIWAFTLIPFRANDLADATWIATHLGSGWSRIGDPVALGRFLLNVGMDPMIFAWCLLLIPLVEVVDYARRDETWQAKWLSLAAPLRSAADYVLLFTVLIAGRFDDVAFIYFQF